MWEWIGGIVLSALLGVTFTSLKDRLRAHRGVRIETEEESGPVSREHGFTENAVKVTIKNTSGTKIEIQDIRLMFAKTHGFPVLPTAPPLRSHFQLPATLDSGVAKAWYFPAEQLARHLKALSSKPMTKGGKTKLRPWVTTTTGKVYRGTAFRFSMDVNSDWPW